MLHGLDDIREETTAAYVSHEASKFDYAVEMKKKHGLNQRSRGKSAPLIQSMTENSIIMSIMKMSTVAPAPIISPIRPRDFFLIDVYC